MKKVLSFHSPRSNFDLFFCTSDLFQIWEDSHIIDDSRMMQTQISFTAFLRKEESWIAGEGRNLLEHCVEESCLDDDFEAHWSGGMSTADSSEGGFHSVASIPWGCH